MRLLSRTVRRVVGPPGRREVGGEVNIPPGQRGLTHPTEGRRILVLRVVEAPNSKQYRPRWGRLEQSEKLSLIFTKSRAVAFKRLLQPWKKMVVYKFCDFSSMRTVALKVFALSHTAAELLKLPTYKPHCSRILRFERGSK